MTMTAILVCLLGNNGQRTRTTLDLNHRCIHTCNYFKVSSKLIKLKSCLGLANRLASGMAEHHVPSQITVH